MTLAQDAIHQLGVLPAAGFALVDEAAGVRIGLNEQMFDMLRAILIDLAQNLPVAIVPLDHELTIRQAADLLKVSRGFILCLIEKRELPCRMVGTHRRIRLEDLLALTTPAPTRSIDSAIQYLSNCR